MVQHMNKKRWTFLLLFTILLLSTLVAQQAQAASKSDYHYEINRGQDTNLSPLQGDVYKRNGILYVQLDDITGSYNLQASFDATGKRAGFNGWLRKLAVRDGSNMAIVNGKTAKMAKPAYFAKQKESKDPAVYVPFQFAVEALGGKYTGYNAKTKTVTAKDLPHYNVSYTIHDGITYGVQKDTGSLLSWDGKNQPVKMASLQNKDDLDWVSVKAKTTPKGLLLLTIDNSYGEPHNNNETYQLLFKNNKMICQTYDVLYWGSLSLIDSYNGNILLNDGKKLRVIEDGSGNILETIDLIKVGNMGANQRYSIEAMDDDMLLMRSNVDYRLYLVNRHNERSIIVYKEVLPASDQKDVEWVLNDTSGFIEHDKLEFNKRVGNTLYFTFHSPASTKSRIVTYDLSKLNSK